MILSAAWHFIHFNNFSVTGPDGQVRFNLEADKSEETEKKKPAILEHNLTNFGQKLWDTDGNDSSLLETLKAMGPSAIDLEIVALSPEGTYLAKIVQSDRHLIVYTHT